MVERIKIIRFINTLAMLSVASFNALDCYVNSRGANRYFLYVAPFFILSLVILLWKNYKVNAVLYAAAGIIIALTGGNGNFSGAIFLIFSIYIFNTFKTMSILLILTALSIVSRCVFLDYTIPDTINLFIAYAFSFGIYFILIHPKPEPPVSLIDDDAIEILEHIKRGKKSKEIADILNLTYDQVRYKMKKAKEIYGCSTEMELYGKLKNLGIISKNMGKLP